MGASRSKGPTVKQELARVRSCERLPQVTGRYHRLPRRIDDDYVVGDKELGQGHNGSVYLATSRSTGEQFAVKPFKLFRISKAKQRELRNEVEVTLAMDHPHVARLRDVYEDEDYLQLVTERLMGGELFDRIQKLQRFSESDAREATYQILLAVNYLHSKGIVHRDIKLENFLYDSKEYTHLKLIDFGFSRFTTNKRMKLGCGTLAYMAPEVINGSYNEKCDLWSVGVVVFILLLGYMPFRGNEVEVHNAIIAGRFRIKAGPWSRVSQTGRRFIETLLETDHEKRPSAEVALQHPWLVQQWISETEEDLVDESIVNSLREYAKASRFRKACMSMMAWSLTNEERKQVRAAFVAMDTHKTGTLSLFELKTVLQEKISVSDDEVKEIFDALDSNDHDDQVNYSDFLAAMMASRIALHDDMLLDTFKRFDLDNSGFINVDNVREILGGCLSLEETEEIMREADVSRDGQISWEEFVQYMQSGGASPRQLEAMDKVIEQELQTQTSCKSTWSSRNIHKMQAKQKATVEENYFPEPNKTKSKPKTRICVIS